jgi:hypothetical protein
MGLFGTNNSIMTGFNIIPEFMPYGDASITTIAAGTKTSTGTVLLNPLCYSLIMRMPVDGSITSIYTLRGSQTCLGTLTGVGTVTAGSQGWITSLQTANTASWIPSGTVYPGSVDQTTAFYTYAGTTSTAGGTATFNLGSNNVGIGFTNSVGTASIGMTKGTYFAIVLKPYSAGLVISTGAATGTAAMGGVHNFLGYITTGLNIITPTTKEDPIAGTVNNLAGTYTTGTGSAGGVTALQTICFAPNAIDVNGSAIPYARFGCNPAMARNPASNFLLTNVVNNIPGTASTASFFGNRIILPYSISVSGIMINNTYFSTSADVVRVSIYSASGSTTNDTVASAIFLPNRRRVSGSPRAKTTTFFSTPVTLAANTPYYYGLDVVSTAGANSITSLYTGLTLGTGPESSSALLGTVGSTLANLNLLDDLGTRCCLAVRSSGGTAPFNWALDLRMRAVCSLVIDSYVLPDIATGFNT